MKLNRNKVLIALRQRHKELEAQQAVAVAKARRDAVKNARQDLKAAQDHLQHVQSAEWEPSSWLSRDTGAQMAEVERYMRLAEMSLEETIDVPAPFTGLMKLL